MIVSYGSFGIFKMQRNDKLSGQRPIKSPKASEE